MSLHAQACKSRRHRQVEVNAGERSGPALTKVRSKSSKVSLKARTAENVCIIGKPRPQSINRSIPHSIGCQKSKLNLHRAPAAQRAFRSLARALGEWTQAYLAERRARPRGGCCSLPNDLHVAEDAPSRSSVPSGDLSKEAATSTSIRHLTALDRGGRQGIAAVSVGRSPSPCRPLTHVGCFFQPRKTRGRESDFAACPPCLNAVLGALPSPLKHVKRRR